MPKQLAATAYELDVFAFLKKARGLGAKACVTDLPYPTKERHRRRGTTTRTKVSAKSDNPWFEVLSIQQLCDSLAGIYAALADDAYCFAYVDYDTALLLGAQLGVPAKLTALLDRATSEAPRDDIGFAWWTPGTWVKTVVDKNGRIVKVARGMGYHGRSATEQILVLEKGRAQFRKGHNFDNAFLAPRPKRRPPGATVRASTAKPVEIAAALARAAAAPGDIVIDPFVGCGTHLIGIQEAGCRAIVNDRDLTCFRDWMGPNVYDVPVTYR